MTDQGLPARTLSTGDETSKRRSTHTPAPWISDGVVVLADGGGEADFDVPVCVIPSRTGNSLSIPAPGAPMCGLENADLISAAPELLIAGAIALDILQNGVGADCPHCAAEGTWTDSFGSEPRMVGLVHKPDCIISILNAVIAKAEGR